MDLFLTGIFRWVLATLLLCFIIQKSESAFRISQNPSNPTIVVLGVNSSQVTLVWRYSDAPSQYFVQFWRRKTGEKIKQISSSKDGNAFNPSNTEEFVARLDATLILKNVKGGEEYTYSLFLLDSNAITKDTHAVSIKVVESFKISQKPSNPTTVVLGENSDRVRLEWRYSNPPGQYFVQFYRQKTGENLKQISSSKDGNAFDPSNTNEFEASLEATLTLKNVKRNEEYTYTIFLMDSSAKVVESHKVSIKVVVPPETTIPPEPRPLLTIGKNYTLTCNASGDPLPKITWTKDGIPAEEFNVTGYKLHLTDVKLKDVGSYRCTAGNGYGVDASNVSIAGVKCNDCEIKTIGIKLESETWKSALNNRESIEFKTLQANLLSEISKVYTKSPVKELYTVAVVDFRSGSVIAKVEMKFGKSVTDPLKPLEDEIKDGKLGAFGVKRELDLNPTSVPFTNFSATAASFTNVTSTGYLVTNITVTANPFTNITVTAVPSTTSRASAVPSTTSRASGADQSGDRKKQTMLHVIYSTTIFLLLVIIIVLVFVIWRGKNRQGSLKQKSQQHNHRKNHIDLQANVNMKKHDNSL